MSDAKAIVDVSVATRRVLLRAAILTRQNDAHTAKKLLSRHANALKNMSTQSLAKSIQRGGKERAGYASELDVKLNEIDVRVRTASMLVDEVVGLRGRDSPWEDEWKKCERQFQQSVEELESLGDRGVRLPTVLRSWSRGIAKVNVMSKDGGIEDPRVLSLLERAEFHARLRSSLTAPTSRAESIAFLPLSVPSQRLTASLQLDIGKVYLKKGFRQRWDLEERQRTMRSQERRAGLGGGISNGDDDNVVTQWLDRTALPPPLSMEDCDVQPSAYALTKFSSAKSLTMHVQSSSLRSDTSVNVGLALLALSGERGQCVGVWPRLSAFDRREESIYANSLRRVDGDGHLMQARSMLLNGMQEAMLRKDWSVVRRAAKGLADTFGSTSPKEAAKYISLWQSCAARSDMFKAYRDASRSTAPEFAFVRRLDNENDDDDAGTERHYLSQNSMAWKRMDCSTDGHAIVSMLPTDVPVLTLQCDENMETMYVCAQRNTGETNEDESIVVQAAAYRHSLTYEETTELKKLLKEMDLWKKRLATSIARMGSSPSLDRTDRSPEESSKESSKESPEELTDPTDVEFQRMEQETNLLFNQCIATKDVMNVLRTGAPQHCVICIDTRLQSLPIESISSLLQWRAVDMKGEAAATAKAAAKAAKAAKAAATKDGKEDGEEEEEENKEEEVQQVPVVPAPSLSRDFSLHVLGARLISSGGEIGGTPLSAPSTSLGSVKYIIDSRNEDRPDGTEDSTQISNGEAISTVDATFEHVMETCGGTGSWEGIRGKNSVPSWAEWQRTLCAAGNGGMFLSYGLGPCLSHFPPERLAGISANGGVRVAMLVGRSSTESSLRRLAKLANKKTSAQIRLEGSIETSMLMTLAGADCVIINGWASSLSANRRMVLSVMANVSKGKTIAKSVDEALERGSSAVTGGNDDGKKKGKKDASEEEKVMPLKARVRANAIVFGIPHMMAKK